MDSHSIELAEARLATVAYGAMAARRKHGERSPEYRSAIDELNRARRALSDLREGHRG